MNRSQVRPAPGRPAPVHRSTAYGTTSRAKRGGESERQSRKTRQQLMQLLFCVALFGLTFLIKTFYPSGAEVLRETLARGVNNTEEAQVVFSDLGRAISGEGDILQAIETFSGRFFGLGGNDLAVSDQEPMPADLPGKGEDVSKGKAEIRSGAADASADEGLSARGDLISRALESSRREALLDAAEVSPSSAPEDLSLETTLSEEDLADDTPAEEFEIPPPDIVDATPYTIAFNHMTPVYGEITSPFGYRDHPLDGETKFHHGVDVAAASGSDILCFADGVVKSVSYNGVYGNYLQIEHEGGYISFYAHCSKILVKSGQRVAIGQRVALVGATGQVSGPHLHFEIRKDGKILDPMCCVDPEKTNS